MKILIIEDDKYSANMLADMLRPLAREILIAHSMAEASRIIIESGDPPEIITIDLTLPDSGHKETISSKISHIRSHAPNALIIVITGMIMTSEDVACIKGGADAVFEKMDVASPKTIMEKLRSLVLELMRNTSSSETKLRILDAVAACMASFGKGEYVQPATEVR